MKQTIINYLTLAFQNEMIDERCAKSMAIEFVGNMTPAEIMTEYLRITKK